MLVQPGMKHSSSSPNAAFGECQFGFVFYQQRNEPSNISIACEYVAKLKKVDVETVARITTENAFKLFPKLADALKSQLDVSVT